MRKEYPCLGNWISFLHHGKVLVQSATHKILRSSIYSYNMAPKSTLLVALLAGFATAFPGMGGGRRAGPEMPRERRQATSTASAAGSSSTWPAWQAPTADEGTLCLCSQLHSKLDLHPSLPSTIRSLYKPQTNSPSSSPQSLPRSQHPRQPQHLPTQRKGLHNPDPNLLPGKRPKRRRRFRPLRRHRRNRQ